MIYHGSIGNKLFGFVVSRSDEPLVIGVCGMRSDDQDHRIVSEPIASGSFLESGPDHQRAAMSTLQWRHNGRDGVSNHQPHHRLLNCLFRRRSKRASKRRVTNAENVSIWWRHHVDYMTEYQCSSLRMAAVSVLIVCELRSLIWKKKTWWRHQMETFPRYWPFVRGIRRSPVNSSHKGEWRGALMFFWSAPD